MSSNIMRLIGYMVIRLYGLFLLDITYNRILLTCLSVSLVSTHFKKWWNCLTVQWDHLKPLEVCRRSLMMKPSSHRHLRAPGPPRYDGGGEPSCTAPSLQ